MLEDSIRLFKIIENKVYHSVLSAWHSLRVTTCHEAAATNYRSTLNLLYLCVRRAILPTKGVPTSADHMTGVMLLTLLLKRCFRLHKRDETCRSRQQKVRSQSY